MYFYQCFNNWCIILSVLDSKEHLSYIAIIHSPNRFIPTPYLGLVRSSDIVVPKKTLGTQGTQVTKATGTVHSAHKTPGQTHIHTQFPLSLLSNPSLHYKLTSTHNSNFPLDPNPNHHAHPNPTNNPPPPHPVSQPQTLTNPPNKLTPPKAPP